jgi:hypothetical protein
MGNGQSPQGIMTTITVLVAALVFLLGHSTVAFSTGSLPSRSSRICMGDTDAPITPRSRPRKQSAANEMALKIGLDIAPKGSTNKNDMNEGKKKLKGHEAKGKDTDHAMPVISWGSGMERFFWPSENPKAEALPSGRRSTTTKMTIQHITNKESFPLVLLREHCPRSLSPGPCR